MPRHKPFTEPVQHPKKKRGRPTKRRQILELPLIGPHIVEAAVESFTDVDMVLMSMPSVTDPKIKSAQRLLAFCLTRYSGLSRLKIVARCGLAEGLIQSAIRLFEKRMNRTSRHFRPEFREQLDGVDYLVRKIYSMEQHGKPCFIRRRLN